MAKHALVKMKDIRLPDLYIRAKGPDDAHLAHLRAVIKDSLEDQEKLTPENWPLDAIIVQETEPKRGRRYEIIEGVHRYMLAHDLKLDAVPCEIRKYESVADAHAAQLTENLKKKLGIDLDSRDTWVRMLVNTDGIKQDAVAKIAGLSKASVSKILKGEQRGEGRKKAGKRKGKKRGKKSKVGSNGFDAGTWYSTLYELTGDYEKNGEAIRTAKQSADPERVAAAYNVLDELVRA
jgi:hypothetical protein